MFSLIKFGAIIFSPSFSFLSSISEVLREQLLVVGELEEKNLSNKAYRREEEGEGEREKCFSAPWAEEEDNH